MDFRQIDYFITLYETRTVRGAADKLFISQQGLSRSIRELEAELDVELFTRSPRGMTPTRAGTYFYNRMVPLQETYRDVCRNVSLVCNDVEHIEVPCAYGVMLVLYRPIKEFEKTHEINVTWEQSADREVERKLLTGQRQLGISVRNPFESGLEFRRIYSSAFVAVVREDNELTGRGAIRCEDLRNRPIAYGGSDSNTSRILLNRCAQCGFEPNIVMETHDLALSMRLVKMGEAITVLPEALVRVNPIEGTVQVPFADAVFRWEVGVVWKTGTTPADGYKELADWLV